MRLAIVGAGVFGVAAAVEAATRGHQVTVYEQGDIPNPRASSTDVSKAIRRTWYVGDNDTYVELAERSALQWEAWEKRGGRPLLHRAGALFVVSDFEPGDPMHESYRFLRARGAAVEMLQAAEVRQRFPMFTVADDQVGVYDPWAGYLESGVAVATMAGIAAAEGAVLRDNTAVDRVAEEAGAVTVDVAGRAEGYDAVLVCGGAWMGRLLPELAGEMRVTRQEMLLLRPDQTEPYRYPAMPVWALDPDSEGWYGFPLLAEGVVKVALDLAGELADADIDRRGTTEFRERALRLVADFMPTLADATVTEGRTCLYTSSPDDDFVIDAAPGCHRLFVAGAGSGHGFKFGGSLGPLIVDAVEGRPNPLGERFHIGTRFRIGERFGGGERGGPEGSASSAHGRGFAAPPQKGEDEQ